MVARDIASRIRGSLAWSWRRIGRSDGLDRAGRRRGRGHSGRHFVEQFSASVRRLLFCAFAVPVRMLRKAGLADYLGGGTVHETGNGVIQEEPAARAIIIDQIAKPFCRFSHARPIRAGGVGAPWNGL